jgi:RNA polymerase sigma-70 factor (ECF subfamily)
MSINMSVFESSSIYNENELLLKLEQGDEKAFSFVYKEYYTAVFLYAERIALDNLTIAQDATAEAFIELWKGRRRFENISHLLGFLRTVAHNKCIDQYRKIKRQTTIQNELLYLTEWQQENIFFNQVLLEAGLLTKIRAEVERLPAHTREVFKLSFFDQLKNAEIAIRLNITDATVRRRKTEALHSLRKTFRGLDPKTLKFLTLVIIHDF